MLIAFNKTDFFNKLFPEVDTNNDEAVKQKLSEFYHPKRIQIKLEGEKILVQFLETWEENRPDDFFKATRLCTSKRYDEAIPIFHKLIMENPTDSEYYRNLAQAYEESGEYEKAIDHLIDALRWDPSNHWALLLMGNIYIKYLNDLQTATTYFEQVLEVDSKNHLVLSNIGGLFLKANKSKLAERFFNKALESNPKFPNALHGKALLENERGNILKSFELGIEAQKNADQEDLRNVLFGFVTNIATRYVKEEISKNRVTDYINELKEHAKTDIRLGEDPAIPVEAKLEMAEIYGRKHHKVLYKNETPLLPHLIAHELTHLKYFEDAKRADCYYHFTSGATEKSRFTKLMDSSIAKL
jgi:tetratricopeptide (TPR) repeat protein